MVRFLIFPCPLLASCQWGPATAHGVGTLTEMYVIYMVRYASHLSRDASAWEFATIWHLASHYGNLPILGSYSRGWPLVSYVQYAKYSWHAGKSTKSDPHLSSMTPYLTSVTYIGPGKAHFLAQRPMTFDLGSHEIRPSWLRPTFLPNMESIRQAFLPF